MDSHNYIYIFIILLLVVFLVVSSRKKPLRNDRFRRTANALSITAIIMLLIIVIVFPRFNSVKSTGIHPYTSCTIELADDNSNRNLSLLVHYPNSYEIQKNSCPMVVFSHGGISTNTSNLSLYKELASHGYVVVSIAHTYHAISTKIEGKKISIDKGYMKELLEEDSNSDIENSFNCFKKWMKLRTEDINLVIDTFKQKAEEQENTPYCLIDIDRIGLVGHSLGGAAVLGVARQRSDIKAVIALESPYMCDIIGVDGDEFIWNTEPYSCNVMNIYSDDGYALIGKDNKYVQNENMYKSDGVENHHIPGSNHYTLTDLVRTSPVLCAVLGGGYSKSGYDTLKFINEKSVAFFDRYLKTGGN